MTIGNEVQREREGDKYETAVLQDTHPNPVL